MKQSFTLQEARRNMRLPHYDYTQAGCYFITSCAVNRQCLFGEVIDNEMRLNDFGTALECFWEDLPEHFPSVRTDAFIVMPNHIHGVLFLSNPRRGEVASLRRRRSDGEFAGQGYRASPMQSPSLGQVMAYYKYRTTKLINTFRKTAGQKIWQRGYYEHIVRNEDDLQRIRTYIENNPLQWAIDKENPSSQPAL